MLCQDLYFSLALTLCRYASFFILVFNFINVQEILELFRSATSTAAHRSKITDQSRGGGGGGALFLEQFLTSGGNPFVKENEQQVINNKWNERVGER